MNGIFGEYKVRPQPDAILGLKTAFNKDSRPDKLDLAIGYLYDEEGKIYIPPSIDTASKRTLRIQRGYLLPTAPLGWNGNTDFIRGVVHLVLGKNADELLDNNLVAASTTIGGTQAVSLFAEAVHRTKLGKNEMPKIIIGNPAYLNHPAIFNAAGLEAQFYPHLTDMGKFNIEAVLAAIKSADETTIFLFQGVEHNPTGINAKTEEEWRIIAKAMKASEATAFFDLPYAGLNGSLQEDTMPARIFFEEGVNTAIAFSLSKISGLYAERIGVLLTVCPDEQYALDTTSLFNRIIRKINSSSAGWGQRIMAEVFNDKELSTKWITEDLPEMARILKERRKILSDALPEEIAPIVRGGAGLFTVLPIKSEGTRYLRQQHGIYVVQIGENQIRVNIGGATLEQMHTTAKAIRQAYDL